jgi:HrpA-like RNA helicase
MAVVIYSYLVASALKSLWLLGAIDNSRNLTHLGREMALLPLEPAFARALLASCEYDCTRDVLDIVSILSASSKLFLEPPTDHGLSDMRDTVIEARKRFRHASGDHMTALNVFRAWDDISGTESKVVRQDWCKKNWINMRALMEASDIRTQLRASFRQLGSSGLVGKNDASTIFKNPRSLEQETEANILKCLAHGLLQNSAFLQPDGSYKQTMGQQASF